jgi:predicted nucleotidyltransferase/DNA-binding transcriptional ArsR family regulator
MENKLKIIKLLEENRQGLHIREISRQIKTGLPNIKRYLDILEKEKIIRKEKKANLVNITLTYKSEIFPDLKQINSNSFLDLPKNIRIASNDFLMELEEKPLISLIFGSYAKGNYNKNSDLDIFLVFQELKNEKRIEETAKRIGMRTNVKINPIYISYPKFKKDFLDKNHNFSNEIRNKVILLNGIEYYYELIREFIK